MPLQYFDKLNRPITARRWLELSATITEVPVATPADAPEPDPFAPVSVRIAYTHCRTDYVAPGKSNDYVETSWCGVVCSSEKRPGVFLVRLVEVRGSGDGKTKSPVTEEWCGTASEADAVHERVLRAARSKGAQAGKW